MTRLAHAVGKRQITANTGGALGRYFATCSRELGYPKAGILSDQTTTLNPAKPQIRTPSSQHLRNSDYIQARNSATACMSTTCLCLYL